jgi:pimeloyl-ACP methyl ester carboxylesterase
MPENKIIMPRETDRLINVDDVVIVQHGLPGIEWRKRIEDEAIELLKGEGNFAAVFPSQSHTEPFSMGEYMRNASATIRDIQAALPSKNLHLVGQSYGAAAVLQALRKMQQAGRPAPASIHFLSPFVKIATGTQDPEIALSIVNTRLLTDRAMLTPEKQEEILRGVLEACREVYQVEGDLVEEHRQLFGDSFYRAIGDLEEFVSASRVQIIRGEEDPYIGGEHTELIRQNLGQSIPERIISHDGHDLRSINIIEEILSAKL